MAQRRLRAALLLVALLWLPVSIALAITGLLLWVSVPFAVVTLVAVLYWLRTEAQADRAHRVEQRSVRADSHADERSDQRRRRGSAPHRSSRARRRRSSATGPSRRRAAPPRRPDARRARRLSGTSGTVRWREAGHAQQPATAASAHATAYDSVFDVQAAQTGGVPLQPATPAAPAAAAEAAPGSWSPVPVPAPTYSLKAKAEPRYTDDGIPADVFDTPEFADEAEELDDRALFARRAVSG